MLVLVQVFIAMWSCPSALYVMLAIIETVFAGVNIFTLFTCVNIYTFRLGTMTPKLSKYVGDIWDLFSEECRPRNSKNTAEDCHASRPLVACWWWLRVVYTLYCQTYLLTHPNYWMQVFQSLPWPHVYNIKHLGVQTASANICIWIGGSRELSELQHGTMIGCHLYN